MAMYTPPLIHFLGRGDNKTNVPIYIYIYICLPIYIYVYIYIYTNYATCLCSLCLEEQLDFGPCAYQIALPNMALMFWSTCISGIVSHMYLEYIFSDFLSLLKKQHIPTICR